MGQAEGHAGVGRTFGAPKGYMVLYVISLFGSRQRFQVKWTTRHVTL